MTTPLSAEPGSPAWLPRLVQRIEQRLVDLQQPKRPVFVPEYASASALPKASDWRSAVVFAKWIDRLAVSNGTNWIRTDTGATL